MIEIWLAAVYALGTLVGFIFGFKKGVKTGKVGLMSNLILEGFVKTQKGKDGDVILMKVTENPPTIKDLL
jgi:hypothetical protein